MQSSTNAREYGSRATTRILALITCAVVVFSIVLYVQFAARDVMFGDGPELTLAAVLDGVGHPPGYPLWIMLGHLASLLPIGSLPFRVNITACLYHALTVGMVFLSGYVLTKKIGPALFAAGLLGLASPLFVMWSLQAEVFSLNDCFAAAIVLLSLMWLDAPAKYRIALPLAATFGLGMSNHQTLVLLAPLPCWAAWCGRGAFTDVKKALLLFAGSIFTCILCFALPYIHTFVVSQHLQGWHFGSAPTMSALLYLIERRAYGSFDLVAIASERGGTMISHLWALLGAGGWPYAGILAGMAGLAIRSQWSRFTSMCIIILSLLLFSTVASLNIETQPALSTFQRFGLLPLVALAPFSACAVFIVEKFSRRSYVQRAVGAVAMLAVCSYAVILFPARSLAEIHDTRTLYRDISNALPRHAILLTGGDAFEIPSLYFQAVEGWRPDVTSVSFGYLSDPAYAHSLEQYMTVPLQASYTNDPVLRRDILVYTNPKRPFFVAGDPFMVQPSSRFIARINGVVSQMLPSTAKLDLARAYRIERALLSAPGYGDITTEPLKSNGFSKMVRESYAGGFFSAGYHAQRLGDRLSARAWYERAAAYSDNPNITDALQALNAGS